MSQVFPAEVEWDAVWAVKMGSCVQSSQVADHSSIPGSMQTVREKENGRFSNGSRSLFPPRSHQKGRPFVVPDRGTRQAGLLCSATLRTPPHLIPLTHTHALYCKASFNYAKSNPTSASIDANPNDHPSDQNHGTAHSPASALLPFPHQGDTLWLTG